MFHICQLKCFVLSGKQGLCLCVWCVKLFTPLLIFNPPTRYNMDHPPITLTSILQANNADPSSLYTALMQSIDIERVKLDTHAASGNCIGYRNSLNNIYQYQRILSILRRDTLDSISGKLHSLN